VGSTPDDLCVGVRGDSAVVLSFARLLGTEVGKRGDQDLESVRLGIELVEVAGRGRTAVVEARVSVLEAKPNKGRPAVDALVGLTINNV
jgi:hypothetical protein